MKSISILFFLVIFSLFCFGVTMQPEDNNPQYLEVTTRYNGTLTKQFADYSDGETLTEIKDEEGRKINFRGSRAKLANYMHSMGYELLYEEPGQLETMQHFVFVKK